jgi:virulence factor Mce-like protein
MPKTMERMLLEARRSVRPLMLLAGLMVAAGITFALIAQNLTFARPWQKYREVNAQFTDVKGIFPGGHQVRIHGVKVGVVSKSRLVHGKPQLTLKIEHKWGPVYKDARIQIRPVTPLQDLYVNVIDRGHPSAGEVGKHDVIASSQTVTPVDVSRVLDTFNAPTRQRMTILLTEMGRGLDDGGVKLRASFDQLAPFLHVAQDTTQALAERKVQVQRVVHNFGELSAALAKRDDDLQRFVVQGNSALGELARNDQPLAGTLTELSELLPVMRSSFAAVNALSGHLDPALKDLKPVAAQLQSSLKGLEQVGRDATPALKALRPAVVSLRSMARSLPAASTALQASLTNLDHQAPQFGHITNLLAGCTSSTQRFFENTLSVFKYADANGAFPRADETVDTDTASDAKLPAANLRVLPNCTDGK